MSEKDIKTKPAPTPKTPSIKGTSKIAVKSKDAVTNTVKDAKIVMKDTLVKKAVESKLGTDIQQEQLQKVDTEAAESVENAAYTTAGTAYHKGKTYTQNKIREHNSNKVKTKDNYIYRHASSESRINGVKDKKWNMQAVNSEISAPQNARKDM